ncbi:IS4 family transposase [Streptomyces mirabilis]|uniref:IS4 family transposase n=1 Tax=Streptomyces mirabilis TaxID=68239 RepID=UPI002257E737|nr:IS4 family transposase [Streptomyces mirabilis]MCX4418310.1 IS4 family transposase [Streptomyces mirabilis]MCX4419254.1 IS4 family transposase [Streptomyces mirabilis]MCX4419499.1 IS4 family transposase [Streptomyces mirabilis]MCX4426357.1 IS4 family transposase [Streptomyces mirabilis]
MSGAWDDAAVSGTRLTDRVGIGVLTRLVDRDLVDEVLAGTGRTEKRSRLLPARVVVYYVMGLCLFFGESYEEVIRLLVNGLRFLGTWRKDWAVPTASAISQARRRLGPEPLRVLFERVALPCAQRGTQGAWLGRWRLMAIDGFVLDIPDTPANDSEFGRSGGKKNPAPFPQVKVVGLGECGTHAVVAARLGPWRVDEGVLAKALVTDFEPGMLITADRGFYAYRLWEAAAATGADLLWRMPDGPHLPVVRPLKDGSYESFLLDPKVRNRRANQRHRGSPVEEPAGIPVRVVEYEVTNREGKGEIFCLITTIMDPDEASAAELAAAYAERWELESSLDEIKTHQRGRGGVLRSKTPDMVEQEIWALLLTHYAVRHLMCEAADQADIDPDRLSFIRSLRIIRRQVTDQAGFSPSAPHKRS